MDHERQLVSIGFLAGRFGVSTTTIRAFERRGVIPRGQRVVGSRARVWSADDVALMEARVSKRRAPRKEEAATAA